MEQRFYRASARCGCTKGCDVWFYYIVEAKSSQEVREKIWKWRESTGSTHYAALHITRLSFDDGIFLDGSSIGKR